MRLVTFAAVGDPRIGALVDGDRWIVDFGTAGHGNPDPAFASMQALIASGEPGLDLARETVEAAQKSGRGLIDPESVKLLSPLPLPPQLRDFLCFEKHLIQAFTQMRRDARSERARS